MTILVTGASGFVGRHFCSFANAIPLSEPKNRVDITDYNALYKRCKQIKADYVIHLAGQSFVPDSLANPTKTYEVNFCGTLRLLEALKATNFRGRFLFIGSSHVYGNVKETALPITENHPLIPSTPYAISKIAAEKICYLWSKEAPFEIILCRPFNLIGPGQSSQFVLPNFAKQIIRIQQNSQKTLKVGNIDIERDFTDVRDAIKAYFLLLQNGKNGHVYNVCSAKATPLREMINQLVKISGLSHFIFEEDEQKIRKDEMKTCVGSFDKLYKETNWQPSISLTQTLKDLFSFEMGLS